MESTTITFIGLIVAAIGVVATIVAPRLVRGSRIEAEFESVDRISQKAPTGQMRVDVFHNNEKVDGSLFVARGIIGNIGSKDITKDHFVDPVEIGCEGDWSIISLDVEAPLGVKPTVAKVADRWTVDWSILKPREFISITAVVVSEDDKATVKSAENDLWIIARLSDVKTGKGVFRGFNPWYGAGAFIAVAVIVSFFLLYSQVRPYKTLTLEIDGRDKVIVSGSKGFSACEITDRIAFTECVPVEDDVVVEGLHQGKIQPVYSGMSRFSVGLAAVTAALYGALVLLVTNRRVARRLMRKSGLRLGRSRTG